MLKAILGKKVGMTQIFTEDGAMIPVTVVEAGPCVVTQVKTGESDGYDAVQVGFGAIKEKLVNKPTAGQFKKAGVEVKRYLREFRTNEEFKVGDEIDVKQLEELDDLPDTLDLPVDIWDHKVAAEMRSLLDIFAELVDENQMVAPSGIIQDEQGNTVREYSDGLPAKLSFTLPSESKSFTLALPNGNSISQQVIA